MSTAEALRERANKVKNGTREQLHMYLGANDYLYEQTRRRPAADRRSGDRDGAGHATSLKDAPSKLREAVQHRMEVARTRRAELARRGEEIVKDWHAAIVVKDATALVKTVRQADGAGELAKGLRSWLTEFPAGTSMTATKPAARKPAARKPAAARRAPAKATPKSANA